MDYKNEDEQFQYNMFAEGFLSTVPAIEAFNEIVYSEWLPQNYHRLNDIHHVYASEELGSLSQRFISKIKILNCIITDAVENRNKEARNVLIKIYAKAYRTEYNTLKKFKVCTIEELCSILDSSKNTSPTSISIARISFMAKLLNIKLVQMEEINVFFKHCRKQIFKDIYVQSRDYGITPKDEEQAKRKVQELLNKHPEFVDYYTDINLMTAELLHREKISTNITHTYDDHMLDDLSETYCYLSKTWADSTLEDLAYATAIQNLIKEMEDFYNITYADYDKILFCGDGVQRSASAERKYDYVMAAPAKANDDEITDLRKSVKKKEQEIASLRGDLRQLNKDTDSLKKNIELSKEEKAELSKLREYVYNLTEADEDLQTTDEATMRKVIASKKIAIVGGHINWINKMKKEFPEFRYFSAASVSDNALENIDLILFFTDTISHKTYYHFINMAQAENIPFSYLHSVNIKYTINNIYHEVLKLK